MNSNRVKCLDYYNLKNHLTNAQQRSNSGPSDLMYLQLDKCTLDDKILRTDFGKELVSGLKDSPLNLVKYVPHEAEKGKT